MATFRIPHQSSAGIIDPAKLLENFKSLEDSLNGAALLIGTVIVDAVFSATPDTELSITHTLGRIPVGWITTRLDKQANIFESDFVNWTSTVAKFKVASVGVSAGVQEIVTAKILLF